MNFGRMNFPHPYDPLAELELALKDIDRLQLILTETCAIADWYMMSLVHDGYSQSELARRFNITRQEVFRAVRRAEALERKQRLVERDD